MQQSGGFRGLRSYGGYSAEELLQYREYLLKYCGLETLAMINACEELREAADSL